MLGPVLVLLLLLVGLVLLRNEAERGDPSGDRDSTAAVETAEAKSSVSDDAVDDPAIPAISPVGDGEVNPPPGVLDEAFARVGVPTPVRPYPRGPNAERRYPEPVVRDLPEAAFFAPAIPMAMTPADGRVALLPEEIDVHTKTSRRMVLDVAALEAVAEGDTARLVAPLPDGSALTLLIKSVRDRGSLTKTLEGEVEGEPQKSVVQLVLHDGIVHGSVAQYHIDRHIEYRVLASGHLMVRELDGASMTAECGGSETAADEALASAEEPAENVGGGGGEAVGEEAGGDTSGYNTVDLVTGYDMAARIADGGYSQIEARILDSVDRMNLAFSNSQIALAETMLLGTIEDPHYEFPGAVSGSMSSNDELGDLNDTSINNPELNTVSNYATALGADLRAFVLKDVDGSAGIAYLPGRSSITARTYMTSNRITFAHELGHNFGARHSWGDSGGDASTTASNYGWRLAPAGQPRVRTIMAYDWSWGSGQRIPYYANPAVTYQGARTGQINGYNATGDTLSDSRYVSGGLEGTHGAGFNGSNPSLGARNALTIQSGAASRASQATRTNFQVLSPAGGVTWLPGQTREIYWTGGDHLDTVSIQLFRSGVFVSTLASGLDGHQRKYNWTIPAGLTQGGNYLIRVVRNGSLAADSGLFAIGSGTMISQTITFSLPSSRLTTQTVTLSATGGGSGNPVTFAVTSGPGVINGNLLSFTTSGIVEVTANQAGNADYAAAVPVTRSVLVTKAPASVTLNSLSQTYNGTPRHAGASTSPSGLAVNFTYNGSPTAPISAGSYTVVATINNAIYQGSATGTLVVSKIPASVTLHSLAQTYNGTARNAGASTSPAGLGLAFTYNGSATAPVNAGSYTVVATINDPNYQGSATGTLVVAKASATVNLSNLAQVYNGSTRPVSVSTTPGGLSVSLSYNSFPSAPVSPGSYNVVATVENTNYYGTNTATLVVDKAPQTIAFDAIPPQFATAVVPLAANGGGSGNSVLFSVAEGPGEISGGNSLAFTGSGNVRVVATQAGNSNYYDAAPVEQTIAVTKASAAIQLTILSQVYDGTPRSAAATTDPPDLQVHFTYDGSSTAPTSAGSYALVATVVDSRYEGSVAGEFVVEKASATVTLSDLVKVYDGNGHSATTSVDPPGTPLLVTYDGEPTPPVGAGSYTVVATVSHPSLQGSASGTLLIEKAPQTIDFPLPTVVYTNQVVDLVASGGGSGHPVVFEVVEGSASISAGNELSFQDLGEVTIRATQAGDANHQAATPVLRSFTVSKFPATVTLTALQQPYDGTPKPVTVTTEPPGLNVTVLYDLSSVVPTAPGSYEIVAYLVEDFYEGDAGGILVISKGVQTIDFPPIPDQPADAEVLLSATGGPSGEPVAFEIAGGPGEIVGGNRLRFTAAGTVSVRAVQGGSALYDPATPVVRTLEVSKAPASLTLGDLLQTYDGAAKTPSATTVPPGLAVAFTYNGSSEAPSNAGDYALVAAIADPRYEGSAQGNLVVAKAAQNIAFQLPAAAAADASLPLVATGGGSTQPVTFAVTSGPGAITGGNLAFTGAGEVEVTASQDEDANHFPAPPSVRTVLVSKSSAATIQIDGLHRVADGSPRVVTVSTEPPGLARTLTYDGSPAAPVAPGHYEVVVTLDDPVYEGSAAATLVVDDASRLDLVPGGSLPALSSLGELGVETFQMGRYEVTWGLWKTVRDWAAGAGYDLASSGAGSADDHPVRGVSWLETVKWCNARTEWENATFGTALAPAYTLGGSVFRSGEPDVGEEVLCDRGTSGYRLPAADEREYAARGGTLGSGFAYPGGSAPGPLAWYADTSVEAFVDLLGGRGTWPAGTRTPNELGLHDLAGNVAEWTAEVDPSAPSQRFAPGGDWASPAADLLSAALASAPPTPSDRIGLRVARSVSEALAAAVDDAVHEWDSGGTAPWLAQTAESHTGTAAAASDPLDPSEASWVGTRASGPGNLTFRWKLALPVGGGGLSVSVGGEEEGEISGSTEWLEHSVYVPPGDHVVRWIHSGPELGSPPPAPLPGNSGAWLDAVAFAPAGIPQLSGVGVSAIGETSATASGEVFDDGGAPVTERGFVLATAPLPEFGVDTAFADGGGGSGVFSSDLGVLSPGTTYYLRAYAVNDAGVGYGAESVFSTAMSVDVGDEVREGGELLRGDRKVFRFTLGDPRFVDFSGGGDPDLLVELYDGEGELIASFVGHFDFEELLREGNYELHLSLPSEGGNDPVPFDLGIDAGERAFARPDVMVGSGASPTTGAGSYLPSPQRAAALSRRARRVNGSLAVANRGNLPVRLAVRGGGGNAFFAVSYLGAGGNVTAAMLTGRHLTPEIDSSRAPDRQTVRVTPNKRKLTKKKGRRVTIARKTLTLSIGASAVGAKASPDAAAIRVQTK